MTFLEELTARNIRTTIRNLRELAAHPSRAIFSWERQVLNDLADDADKAKLPNDSASALVSCIRAKVCQHERPSFRSVLTK